MLLQIVNIKVFKAPKPAQMKKKADGDNLTIGHHLRALGRLANHERTGRFVEIFTKFINKTENIANFIEVNHVNLYLNI